MRRMRRGMRLGIGLMIGSGGRNAVKRWKAASSLWAEGEDAYSTITSDAYEAIQNQGQVGGQLEQATPTDRPALAHVVAGGAARPVALYGTSDNMTLSVTPSHLDNATEVDRILVFRCDDFSTSYNIVQGSADTDLFQRISSVGKLYSLFNGGTNANFAYSDSSMAVVRTRYRGAGGTNPERVKMYLNEVEQSVSFTGVIPTSLVASHTSLQIGTGRPTVVGALIDLVGPACVYGPAIAQYLLNKYVNPNVFLQLGPWTYYDDRYSIVADDAGRVTGWWDVSGNNTDGTQTVEAEQPLDGGEENGIQFGAGGRTDDNLDIAGKAMPAANTIAFVGRCYSGGLAEHILRTNVLMLRYASGGGLYWYDNANELIEAAPLVTALDWFTLVATQTDGSNLTVRFNGVEVINKTPASALATRLLTYLGGNNTSDNARFDARTLQHYPRVLTDEEILTWMQEANDVWNLGIRPAQLVPGNLAEWDASETSTVHTDAHGVYQWDDTRDRVSATQSTDAYKSGYTSGESVDFTDTESHHLIADTVAAYASGDDVPVTVIIVCESADNGTNQRFYAWSNSSPALPCHIFGRNSANHVPYRRDSTGASASDSVTVASPALIEDVFSGTQRSIRVNGGTPAIHACDVGAVTLDRFTIGAWRFTTVIQPMLGKIRHLLIYNRALSAAELTFLRNYLNAKWNVYS